MANKVLPYGSGSVFLVPLPAGGIARGVVARTAPKGKIVTGYFFGPRLAPGQAIDLSDLSAEKAIYGARIGDLGLVNGSWIVLRTLPSWDPTKWPTPPAVRRDPLGMIPPILVEYDDKDPSIVLRETPFLGSDDVPTDGLAGYRFVELKLDKLLA